MKRELEAAVNEVGEDDPELEAYVEFYLASHGHYLDPSHDLARTVARAHQTVHGEEVILADEVRMGGVSCDNSPLMEYDIPSIQYGAAGINAAGDYSMYEPGVGEIVRIENLAATARVYAASIA